MSFVYSTQGLNRLQISEKGGICIALGASAKAYRGQSVVFDANGDIVLHNGTQRYHGIIEVANTNMDDALEVAYTTNESANLKTSVTVRFANFSHFIVLPAASNTGATTVGTLKVANNTLGNDLTVNTATTGQFATYIVLPQTANQGFPSSSIILAALAAPILVP